MKNALPGGLKQDARTDRPDAWRLFEERDAVPLPREHDRRRAPADAAADDADGEASHGGIIAMRSFAAIAGYD